MLTRELEIYLDKYENCELSDNIYTKYLKFNYPDEELYKLHLDFMLKNIYHIKLVKKTRKRLNQTEFRNKILKKFNNTCIITRETCLDELTAAHIVPVSEDENYDPDNGLLLRENIHRTFDNYKWSINPETLTVEIKQDTNVGQIKQYEGLILTHIKINEYLLNNLKKHYEEFKKMK